VPRAPHAGRRPDLPDALRRLPLLPQSVPPLLPFAPPSQSHPNIAFSFRFAVLGTQLKSLYRFGRTSNYARQLDDFKFCMVHNDVHEEQRRDAWIHRVQKSSEDVWEVRT
jgi:hypothetical protein